MKILHWKYIAPRLLIVLLLACCAGWGIDPLLHWALVQAGPSGVPVEVAALKTSLPSGTIQLQGLKVAHPDADVGQLFQAREAELKIDFLALCHRRLVIRHGLLSGIEFDNPANLSGRSEKFPPAQAENQLLVEPWIEAAAKWAIAWLDELDTRCRERLVDQFQAPQVAQQIQLRWLAEYAVLEARLQAFQARGSELEGAFHKVHSNPLRHRSKLHKLRYQLTEKQQEIIKLQQQIDALPERVAVDQRALQAAYAADQALLVQDLPGRDLDQESLQQAVLRPAGTACLAASLEWIGWVRQKIRVPEHDNPTARSQGTTVLFGPRQPRYLIEHLQLQGRAQWAGQQLAVQGQLRNASSAPQLHDEPMQLTLQGAGGAQVALEITMDHRGQNAQDTLRWACPQFFLPGLTVGQADQLTLEIPPSLASVEMYLQVQEDQISGEIHLTQPALQLQTRLVTTAMPQTTTLPMPLAPWQARFILGGTLDQPEVHIDSNLGRQLAASVKNIGKNLVAARGQQLLAASQAASETHWQQLTTARQEVQQKLSAQLGAGQTLLEHIAALSETAATSVPGTRLSSSLRLPTQRK